MLYRHCLGVAVISLSTLVNAARVDAQTPEVKVEKDIAHGTHERQKLDLSMPGSSSPTPLII